MTLPKQPSVDGDDENDDDDDEDTDTDEHEDDNNGDDDGSVDCDVAFRDGVPVQLNNFVVFGMPLHPLCCWMVDANFCDGAITLGRTFIVFAFIDCFYHYNMMI